MAATAIALAGWGLAFAVAAAPAPWYYWRSLVDGARVCAQVSPGPGWERDSAAFEGPGCQPRRKVLVVPMSSSAGVAGLCQSRMVISKR
ncbi:MAG: hypothetical protein QE495_18710 [Acidovorax sp.]|uniref:hypothetical protein n=1 Tax=Acidovorax sp. TaxID=1872122 RepID=UPI0026197726|nr:hypothetical protein [Acidovorax sp.]MDH4428481.1 hypothetical protein [Acidovorax sp.]